MSAAGILLFGALVVVGCARHDARGSAGGETGEPILITDASQRAAARGKRVRIVGVQTRTKIPTVCGVDVDGDSALAGRRVVVTGVLEASVVENVDPYAASRGPGTFYRVVDPETGRLARPVAE